MTMIPDDDGDDGDGDGGGDGDGDDDDDDDVSIFSPRQGCLNRLDEFFKAHLLLLAGVASCLTAIQVIISQSIN